MWCVCVCGSFDFVWICEVLSHFSRKDKFFSSAQRVLKPQGRIILADWFKAPNLSQEQHDKYIVPIEQGYAAFYLPIVHMRCAAADVLHAGCFCLSSTRWASTCA